MAIKRTITKELNIQTICNTANSFTICRGDSVDFLFTFKNGAEDFDISTATTARIFAKRFTSDGVNTLDAPFFSKEISLDNVTTISASFTSEETAGESGNYLLSVILLDVEENTLTTQAIPFQVVNQGYAGVHQVSEDFRDEVFSLVEDAKNYAGQANEYASTTSELYSQVVALTSESLQSATKAKESETNSTENLNAVVEYYGAIQNDKGIVENTKSEIEELYQNTVIARNEAILAKEQAQEISDPENRIGNLQQIKANRGEFWFNGGSLACANKFQLNTFSCVWTATLNVSDLPTTDNSTWIYTCRHVANSTGFHVGVHQPAENKAPYMWLQFYYYDSSNTCHYISRKFVVDCYDGKPHTYAVIFNGSLIKFLIDSELKLSATLDYDFVPRDCSYPLTIGAITHKISRIKYFNFDMSDANAPYTIDDYISGKDESPLLKLGVQSYNASDMVFSSVNQTTYPCDIVSDSATDTITITTTGEINALYTWIDGRANSISIPQGANVEVSVGDLDVATSVQCYFYSGATRVQTLSGVSNDNPNISFVAQANLTRLSLIVHAGVNPIPTGTIMAITGLKIKVNGALLSLEDYIFKGKVFDTSGNNNTATITGAVYGSKDNAVEQMYQAFASRIQDLITSE